MIGRAMRDTGLRSDRVRLEPDESDRGGQTLPFWYPGVTEETGGYVRSAVKIESGAKSALDPHRSAVVTPYVADDVPRLDLRVSNIVTVEPERTFWDKLVILHGLRRWFEKRGALRQGGQRVTRHYYDLTRLAESDVAGLCQGGALKHRSSVVFMLPAFADDAEAAARKVLSGEAPGGAKDTTGIVEAIRHLTVARDGAIKARAAALCQLGDLVITAPAAVRVQLAVRKTLERKATVCARLRPDRTDPARPTSAAKVALRSIARRIAQLTKEAAALEAQLAVLVVRAAPLTKQQLGLGTQNTAALLIAAGENIDRFRSEAAFAHLCAAASVQASSGRTTRHRLNHNGNRAANRVLHMTVIVRLRYCPRTRAYMQHRVAEGRTKKEVIRCLKRYLVRDVYRTLRADLSTLSARP